MADNATNVKVTADASGYTAELDKATRSANAFSATQAQAAQRVKVAQQAIAEAATNGSNASARALNNFVSQLARTADQAGKTRAELLAMKAAQLGIADSVSGYIGQIDAASAATHEFSLNSGSARRELLVLAHEASQGNWTRFTGSLGVLAERTDALGAIMSSTGLGIGLFAAAAAAAAVDTYKVATAIAALNQASVATNGYIGLTNDQLSAMAESLSVANGGLVATTETMGALIRTGQASASNLAELTAVVTQFGKDAGMSADKAAEAFGKMLDDPAKGMAELQSQYHMFSGAQIEVIEGYVKTGDTAKATQAFIDAVADSQHRMAAEGQQDVGLLTKIWQSFSDAAKQAGDNFDKMGIAATNAQNLAAALKRQSDAVRNLAQAKSAPFGNTGSAQHEVDAANAQVAALQKVQAAQQKIADDNAARAKSGDNQLAVNSYINSSKYASPSRQHDQQLGTENADFAKATANLNKGSAEYQDALKRHYENVAQINAEYAKKTKVHVSEGGINAQLAQLRGSNQLIEGEEKRSADALKAQHEAGLMDMQSYLSQLHDLQASALNQEIANAQQSVNVSATKKNQAAEQEALTEYKKLVDARVALEQQYTQTVAAYEQKRADNVAKFATQQGAVQGKQQQGYNDKNATQFMSPQNASNYTAQQQLYETYLQNVTALNEKYDFTPDADKQEQTQELQNLQESYQKQQTALQAQLAQEQTVRDSYSDQMQLAVTKLAGNGQTGAQAVSSAFTTAWQDSSNALDQFITTGKGNFDTFTAGILADLAKIALHQAEMAIFQSVGTAFFNTGGPVGSYASGGPIAGSGTGTSDSIPAMLSNGEYVINAASTSKYRGLLDSINGGGMSHFASGGAVGSVASSSAGSSSGNPVAVTVHNNGSQGLSQQDAKDMQTLVQAFVDKRMQQKMAGQGGYAYQMRYNQI